MKKELEMNECITFIENEVAKGSDAISVYSEFGKLVIDIEYDCYHPDKNVTVQKLSPGTTKFNSETKGDWYITILSTKSKLHMHLRIVEAMYRTMIYTMFGIDVDHYVIDAAVLIHRREMENKSLTASVLADELMRYDFSIINKNNNTVNWFIYDHFNRRINDAKNVIDNAIDAFDRAYSMGAFKGAYPSDEYMKELIGLLILIGKVYKINIIEDLKYFFRSYKAS